MRLYHGTDVSSANDMLHHGLDPAEAARYNATGEFWATTDPNQADLYAQVNPAQGIPARFEFDVPDSALQAIANAGAVVVHSQATYEFLPPCFAQLNAGMSNKHVVPIP